MTTPYNVNMDNSKTICNSGCKFNYLYTPDDYEILRSFTMIQLKSNSSHKINQTSLSATVYINRKTPANNLMYSYDNENNESSNIIGEIIIQHGNSHFFSIPVVNDMFSNNSSSSFEMKSIMDGVSKLNKTVNINLNNLMTQNPYVYYKHSNNKEYFVYVLYGGGEISCSKDDFEKMFPTNDNGVEITKPNIVNANKGTIQYNQYGPALMGSSSKFMNCVPQYEDSNTSKLEDPDSVFSIILSLAIVLSCLVIVGFMYKSGYIQQKLSGFSVLNASSTIT